MGTRPSSSYDRINVVQAHSASGPRYKVTLGWLWSNPAGGGANKFGVGGKFGGGKSSVTTPVFNKPMNEHVYG